LPSDRPAPPPGQGFAYTVTPLRPERKPPPPPRHGQPPMFNVPRGVAWLVGLNVAVHLLRLILSPEADFRLLLFFGVVPVRYQVWEAVGLTGLLAPVTYQFLHGGWGHLGANMLGLLMFGAGVEQRIGTARMIVFGLACGVIAALVHCLVYPEAALPVIGASGAISGLFGGALRLMVGLGGLSAAARDRQVLIFAAVWIAFEAITRGGMGQVEGVAWVAHIGGFVAGLFLFKYFERPPFR
jgi:membrane associated rhomboid family serine protease